MQNDNEKCQLQNDNEKCQLQNDTPTNFKRRQQWQSKNANFKMTQQNKRGESNQKLLIGNGKWQIKGKSVWLTKLKILGKRIKSLHRQRRNRILLSPKVLIFQATVVSKFWRIRPAASNSKFNRNPLRRIWHFVVSEGC